MADEAFEAKFQMVAGGLTGRYRTLVREVLQRLPSGWDQSRTFTFEIGRGSPGYGCAFRFDEVEDLDLNDLKGHSQELWAVTLYPALLDKLAAPAVRWVIAHELGHVASGYMCGVDIDGRPMTRIPGMTDEYREISPIETYHNERVANAIARAWGFWGDEAIFQDEDERLPSGESGP